ncbi:hypothetical protein [Pectobacterium carotovorum]|uniref:hypothetical protein n=1 Tax=Pectobacterium carotovorum TaxID=554 RepID=UPI00301ABE90
MAYNRKDAINAIASGFVIVQWGDHWEIYEANGCSPSDDFFWESNQPDQRVTAINFKTAESARGWLEMHIVNTMQRTVDDIVREAAAYENRMKNATN